MPALAIGLILLLALPINLSASSTPTCSTFVQSSKGDLSEYDFFICHDNGNNLSVSWMPPPDFLFSASYQVEYQCYNESLLEISQVNYDKNVVIKSQSGGQAGVLSVVVPKTSSSCLVTGCYDPNIERGTHFLWLKKADCISDISLAVSLVESKATSTATTIGAVPSPSSEDSTSSSGDIPLLYPFQLDSIIVSESSASGFTLTYSQDTAVVLLGNGGTGTSVPPALSQVATLTISSSILQVTSLAAGSQSVATETPLPSKLTTMEIFAFSFTSAVIFAIGTMTGVLVALWLCRWQKCNNHQVLKEAEAEIIRLSMKNREFLSLPLGDLNVIITPYTSLESIYIQSFENPQHHVITVRRDGTGKVATAEAHDSSCEQALNALSPEKMELSSFNSDEGYIYQGSPPPYVSSPGQQFGPGSECAVGFSRGTSNEGTAAFLCWKASRSENSLDQGYITSEYIATQECVVDDDVFNQA